MRKAFIVFSLFLISASAIRSVLWHKLCYIRDPQPVGVITDHNSFCIEDFLSHPMHFIGMGSQCLVFAPKDSRYVLKICKATRYQNLFGTSEVKKQRQQRDFDNYQIAFSKLSTQTGIVYLHLNKTSSLYKKIKLIDPFHLSYKVSADNLLFYVQKKATPFADYLSKASDAKKKSLFSSLMYSIKEQTSLGIRIKDIHPLKNIGVVDDMPIWIDPGRMEKKENPYSLEETQIALNKMRSLLSPFFSEQEVDFFYTP